MAFKDGDLERGLACSDCAILLRTVRQSAGPILQALEQAGIPYIVGGMNELFGTKEAQAARTLFYFIAGRPDVTSGTVAKAWREANLGITPDDLAKALQYAESTRQSLGVPEDQQERWGFYNIQRTFTTFLETAGIREEKIPGSRGEVMFYNLGKFSQV